MLTSFTQIYSLSKTLRFELKPVGETADYLQDFKSQALKKFVEKDKQRAEYYQNIKSLIDDYHRAYIEERLSAPINHATGELYVTPELLDEAYDYYRNLKEDSKAWEKVQAILRKQVVKCFSDKGHLFKEALITSDLRAWLEGQGRWEENKDIVQSFSKFTTYFTGFNENRRNMYSSEEQVTAIAYRLMNENLPRFFSNCISYKQISEKYPDLTFNVDPTLLKELGVASLQNIFQPRYFINLFTQRGIDGFAGLLGGKTLEDGGKIQGLNEQINLYRQKKEKTSGKKFRDLPGFTRLYKQILSDRETASFIAEAFENDRDMLDALDKFLDLVMSKKGLLSKLTSSLEKLVLADLGHVYVRKAELSSVSKSLAGNFWVMERALEYFVENNPELRTRRQRKQYLNRKAFSIEELNNALAIFVDGLEMDDPVRERLSGEKEKVAAYFLRAPEQMKNTPDANIEDCISDIQPILKLERLSKNRRPPKQGDKKDNAGKGFKQVETIKRLLDAFMTLVHALKPLYLVDGRKPIDIPDMDTGFYAEFAESYREYSDICIQLYNKTRNHLTQKPFSTDKVKINFDSPTLLNGWDLNKESANKSVILRREGQYYLAVMHPEHSKVFVACPQPDTGAPVFEKINYKLLTGPNKMLPKAFFSKKGLETYNPPAEILALYKNNEHKKGATFKLESCHKLIDFFKENLPKYKVNPDDEFGWDVFNFKFSPTANYEDLSGFYREVEAQGYKLWFSDIPASYIDHCVESGKLFLFRIHNKDFSPYSKGRPNLHTLYWKCLFEPSNLRDVVLKLNGKAEIFFRQHSIERPEAVIHKAGERLENKNTSNPKKSSVFDYEIVKDRRYTQDKFYFHVPITLNFKAQGANRFNDNINRVLAKADDYRVIGIDRGERHLLYYTVVNSLGEIIEQGTLNTVDTDQGYQVDYREILDKRENERDKARKSWSSIENIKELKAGYLSHVIYKLARLIIRHSAIVCLEDLNFGFKRGRFKVEKQVYQKFEKALIDKLNYLVFKEREATEAGGYMKAYQLTAPFVSFEKLGKQSGVLFYVPAAYTSKIDPATGFIDFLRPRYESLAKSKVFFEAIDSFRYNAESDWFEMTFDYANFPIRQNLRDYRTRWTICTHGDTRYHNRRNDKGIWETEKINVTDQLKKLFDDAGVPYSDGRELKQTLIEIKNTRFYKTLFWLFKVTLSLRHSVTGTDEDFILSPVADKNGDFFDSRKAPATLPRDADANGAYHIALKGLWNLDRIKQWDGKSRLNLTMRHEDWFCYVQQRIERRQD